MTIAFEPGIASRVGGHVHEEVSGTLRAEPGDNQMTVAYGVTCKGNGNAFINKETHTALTAGGGMPGQGYPAVLVLNDQGGSRIATEDNISPTLRAQDHGHPPCVLNLNKHDVQSKGVYHEEGIAPALYAGECRYGGGECYVLTRKGNE